MPTSGGEQTWAHPGASLAVRMQFVVLALQRSEVTAALQGGVYDAILPVPGGPSSARPVVSTPKLHHPPRDEAIGPRKGAFLFVGAIW